MPFPFSLKEHAPVLLCLSFVYWATINTSHDWAKAHSRFYLNIKFSFKSFIKKFGPVKVRALKTQTPKYTWKETVDRTWGGGGTMKTRLVPQMNRDAMTSTWLGGSCDLRKTLIGGRLHCASISPAVPRPSRNYSIHKRRKDIKILFPGKYLI